MAEVSQVFVCFILVLSKSMLSVNLTATLYLGNGLIVWYKAKNILIDKETDVEAYVMLVVPYRHLINVKTDL